MPRDLPRPSQAWLLPVVLILAAILRFHALTERGLLYWDEGKFALEGLRVLAAPRALIAGHAAVLDGKAVGTAKPTHALLIAFAYLLLGIHDYSPLFLNATASVLQVAVVYLLALRLFGKPTALLAALFLAVSEYDIIYARSVLSESDANLVFVAGTLLWVLGRSARLGQESRWWGLVRSRFPAALSLGLAFTINYRLSVYIGILIAIDLVYSARSTGWRSAMPAALAWAVGIAVVPLAWDIAGLMAAARGVTLFRSEITYRPQTYFSEALFQMHGGKQAVFHFEPLAYVRWYIARQSLPMFMLLLGGFALTALRRSLAWVVPGALVLGPYLLYVLAPFIVPRNLAASIPFTCILAAATLVTALEAIRARRVRAILLVGASLGLAALGGSGAWTVGEERSGFAAAARYLHTHGHGAAVSNEVMMYYLRDGTARCSAVPLDRHFSSLESAVKGHYTYAVVDVYDTATKRYLYDHAPHVARYLAVGTTAIGENPIASENGQPPGTHLLQRVDIYSIDNLHLPITAVKAPKTCSLDRLA